MDSQLFAFIVCHISWSTCVVTHRVVRSLGGDLLAGMTVASMLIPQSVSYATSLAKLSPVTGLVRNHSRFCCNDPLISRDTVLSIDTRNDVCLARDFKATQCRSRSSA